LNIMVTMPQLGWQERLATIRGMENIICTGEMPFRIDMQVRTDTRIFGRSRAVGYVDLNTRFEYYMYLSPPEPILHVFEPTIVDDIDDIDDHDDHSDYDDRDDVEVLANDDDEAPELITGFDEPSSAEKLTPII
jgi:hypothetical protein